VEIDMMKKQISKKKLERLTIHGGDYRFERIFVSLPDEEQFYQRRNVFAGKRAAGRARPSPWTTCAFCWRTM
jgi:hypothetical protein